MDRSSSSVSKASMAVPILPDHLIEEIFTFLPSKSVGRCRCLSLAWAAALSSDDFARRHFRAANRRRGGLLLLLGSGHKPPPDLCMDGGAGTSGSNGDGGAPPLTFAGIPRALADVGVLEIVAQQCRGLVILQATATGTHYVCNPSTGQTVALPEPETAGRSRYDEPRLGLGYDESTGEHKIVRIYGGWDWDKAGPDVYVAADSSTGAGAFWRRRHRDPPPPPSPEYRQIDQHVPSVFVQDRIYWLAHRRIQGPFKDVIIISYSVSDDTLETVAAPHAMGGLGWLRHHSLVELGGQLCLFSPRRDDGAAPKWQFNLWRLAHQRGLESTWELRCRISLPAVPWPEKGGWVESVAWVMPFPAAAGDDDEDDVLIVQSLTLVYPQDDDGIRRHAGSVKMLTCNPRAQLEVTESLFQVSNFFSTGAALCQESLVSPPSGISM